MSKTPSRQLVSNAECLIDYLAENGSATMADMLRQRLMSAQQASQALQYCIRRGAIAREGRNAPAAGERVVYSLTESCLDSPNCPHFSFEALLRAWGLPDAAPLFTGDASMCRRVIQGCSV